MSETPNGLLPIKFEKWFVERMKWFSLLLFHKGITANFVTLISLLFGLIAGILLAFSYMRLAVLFGIIMGFLDILDGQLASLNNQTSPWGGILDSTIDRVNESIVYFGLGIHYYFTGQPVWALIAAIILVASILVSYVKAAAESRNLLCNVGIMQRSERLVLLALGLLLGGIILRIVLVLLAVLTLATVIQRLLFVRKVVYEKNFNDEEVKS